MLTQSNEGENQYPVYRRSHDRQQLFDAHGELIHSGSRIPCQVLEISIGGCSLRTERPFRPGALATVEVVLPILGMVLHIGGVTQWTNKENQIGIRFNDVNSNSKRQLEYLVDCLIGIRTAESVKEPNVSLELNPSNGGVLAEQPLDTNPAGPDSPGTQLARIAHDSPVHCGEHRTRAQRDGEWPAFLEFSGRGASFAGAILGLTMGGCTFRTTQAFTRKVFDPLELRFEREGRQFLLSGVVSTIYDPHKIGIQFTLMSHRRREGLALLLVERCEAAKTQLEVG
jgi:hypothetical protein